MAETPSSQLWIGRATFLGLAALVIFIQLLPIDGRPDRWAFPDILLAGTLAWTARRPDYAPVLSIAIVFLLADLLFQRPPGLMAALVVIATEAIRSRNAAFRNSTVPLEWATITAFIIAITLGNRLVLAVLMTPQAPLGMTLMQMIATILTYPVVILVAHFLFGVSRPAPGQVDSFGHRL